MTHTALAENCKIIESITIVSMLSLLCEGAVEVKSLDGSEWDLDQNGVYNVEQCVWHSGAANQVCLRLPNRVRAIGDGVFEKAVNVVEVEFEEESILERIGSAAFMGTPIAYIEVPKSVRVIGKGAFAGCGRLEVLDFEDGSQLEVIEDECFSGSRISAVDLPPSLKTMGNRCFASCNRLMSIGFGEEPCLERIGCGFAEGATLMKLQLPESLKSVESGCFRGMNVFEFVFPGRFELPHASFDGVNVKKVVVPGSVTVITTEAFAHCLALSSLSFMPGTCDMVIKYGAFCATSLAEISFPARVTEIHQSAFQSTCRLKVLSFPVDSRLRFIGASAFLGSRIDLAQLKLPDSVEIIGDKAFATYGRNIAFSFSEGSQLTVLGNLGIKRHVFLSFPPRFLRCVRNSHVTMY